MNTRDGGDEGQSSDKKQEDDGDAENDHGEQRSQPTRSSSTSLATTRYSTIFFNLVDASQGTSPCFSARSWMRASQEGILLNGGTRVFTTSKAEPR